MLAGILTNFPVKRSSRPSGGFPGRIAPSPEDFEELKRLKIIEREDNEILVIIKIFMGII
jgi:hypothetical protein